MAKATVEVLITQVPRVWVVTSGYDHAKWHSGRGSLTVWEVESIHSTQQAAERRVAQVGGWFKVVPWDLTVGPIPPEDSGGPVE